MPNIRSCRACESADVELLIDLGNMPLAGGFLSDAAAFEGERRFPLTVYVCARCGLVQILDPVDPDILFQDYSFSSSTIKPLVDHFEAYAATLATRFEPRTVVEFGANDGVLIAPLSALGIRAVGVDISENIAELARERGRDVRAGYFDSSAASALRDELGPVDVVTGSNAFAHNERPERILEGARALLSNDGHLCLEVMYAGDLLEQLQWDTLYHEHLTFYSLSSLSRLLTRFGFTVVDAERLPMHGGSLRVFAAADPNRPPGPRVAELLDYERSSGLADVATWKQFATDSRRKIAIVADAFAALALRHRIWAYGAAGKATMWLNACTMDYVEAVVDASPLRAGKFMPGTHSPIVFPEAFRSRPPDHVFVTAWNYADQIKAKEAWYEGTWSTPLPDLRFF